MYVASQVKVLEYNKNIISETTIGLFFKNLSKRGAAIEVLCNDQIIF